MGKPIDWRKLFVFYMGWWVVVLTAVVGVMLICAAWVTVSNELGRCV